MKRVSYLNVILTINAVLLAAVLLVLSSGSPMGPSEASGQVGMAAAIGSGIPNAGAQRQRMIESLDRLESSVVELRRSVESGRTRVEVTNLDEIQVKSE